MRMPKVQRANPQISQAKGQKQHPQGEIPPGEVFVVSFFGSGRGAAPLPFFSGVQIYDV